MEYLGFQQESGRVRPITSRRHNRLPALREAFRFDFREGTGPGNARSPGISELVSCSGVEGCGTDRRFPFAVGRARMLTFARHVTPVLDLKCFHRAAYIHGGHVLYRISYANIPDHSLGLGRCTGSGVGKWHHVSDIKVVAGKFVQIERPVIWMSKLKRDRVTSPDSCGQLDLEVPRRIRLGSDKRQTAHRDDLNVSDGQFFSGVGVLRNDSAIERNRLRTVESKDK